jgi:hypothetical protein
LKSPLVNSCAHRHDLRFQPDGDRNHAIKSELLNVLYNTGTVTPPSPPGAKRFSPRNDAHMKGLVM